MDLNDAAAYSPDALRFWLSKAGWEMLTSASQGGTGSSGMGSGRGDRATLSCIKADLEHAADQLPLYWQATRYVFWRQGRLSIYEQRRLTTRPVPEDQRISEHPIPSAAYDDVLYRMALALGWREGLAA